jgi:hypothetical protein
MLDDACHVANACCPSQRDDESSSARPALRPRVVRRQAGVIVAHDDRLMSYRDQAGNDWADIIDFLMLHPEARRQVVRVVGEIGAADSHRPQRGGC